MMLTTGWQQVRNVLCIRLDALGDVLMTTPALRALKEGRSGRRLTLMTSSLAAPVAPLVPEVDDWLVYDAPWMKATALRQDSQPDFAMIERLRAARFDAAVIFTVYSQNPLPAALLCLLAGIPRRLAHCRENPYQLLTDWVPESEPALKIRHEVQRQLDLVAAVGCRAASVKLSLRVPEEARERLQTWLKSIGIKPDLTWVLIHPGASAPSRCYGADHYAEVADLLVQEQGLPVVFSGSRSEEKLVDGIRARMRQVSHSLAGRLTLEELAALVALAPVLITNNTGPAHIAAAVGTPVVDLYALTNPQHAPWAVPHRVLFHDVPCKYCYKSICPERHHHCLELVAPRAVAQAACELLGLEDCGTTKPRRDAVLSLPLAPQLSLS